MASPEDFFRMLEVSPEKGILILHGVRHVMLSVQSFAALCTTLIQGFGAGMRAVLYDAGFRTGHDFVGYSARRFGVERLEEVLQHIIDGDALEGWGRYEVVSVDRQQRRVVIRVYNSIAARAFPQSEQPACDFLRGYFAGIFTAIFDQPVRCEETQCMALGNPFCEFRIEPEQ
ncbi:XylR N-terminal domain-containing protein [archaeon]|nr:XylR N-terminal domain-containing protein [archaeon]